MSRKKSIISKIIFLGLSSIIIGFYLPAGEINGNSPQQKFATENQNTLLDSEFSSSQRQIQTTPGKLVKVDIPGERLTAYLTKAGADLGFISTQNLLDLERTLPIKADPIFQDAPENLYPNRTSLNQFLIDREIKITEDQKNLLIWPEYDINAPIIWAGFEDIFGTNPDGSINLGEVLDGSDTNAPIQKKLELGIVHLPISPLPGEEGNSYILGHSSNYDFVKSDYNEVFKNIEKKSKAGDEFLIIDHKGRNLKFRVFESLEIKQDDIEKAYINFGKRRVVTLQSSILEEVNGELLATKRWLTRAELVF